MTSLDHYRDSFLQHLDKIVVLKEPVTLYEPIHYILHLGGKRLRPVFTLMTCELFGKPHQKALDAALAVELFHNFSLIHDDIMDNAPLRRGKKTVHEKWDINTGILSGDATLILAYQLFENYPPEVFQKLAKLFSITAIEVCEGQQYDIDFESREDVTLDEYLHMITNKTAVLLGAAMKMGAIIAEAPVSCQEHIYEFGKNLGIAFQLQDDYLDAFGNPETFGKQVGGDIIENKKTFLYLRAIHNLNEGNAKMLEHLFSIYPKNPEDKIEAVKKIYEDSGAKEDSIQEIKKYTQKAIESLDAVAISEEGKSQLKTFANDLINRVI
ncbi:MAG: polyprenyl synthetase family protein [Flavobacteriaceae bacterium]